MRMATLRTFPHELANACDNQTISVASLYRIGFLALPVMSRASMHGRIKETCSPAVLAQPGIVHGPASRGKTCTAAEIARNHMFNPMRRQVTPAVKGLAPVRLGSRQLLAAAYADGSLRLWDLRRQTCLLHELLKPDSTTVDAMAPTRLRFAPAPTDEMRRPGKLVVQFDRPEPASGAPPHVVPQH